MKAQFSTYLPLKGSERKAPQGTKLKRTNKKELMNVTVRIRPAAPLPDLLNPAVFNKFIPLSREDFSKKYGASEKDIRLIGHFAHHQGLSIVKAEPAKRTMELRGTIKQMESAFKVQLSSYRDEKGKTFRGREGGIQIPQELDEVVEGVFGLDTRIIASPKYRLSKKAKTAGSVSYLPTQISDLYHFPADTTGKNQNIAIIELGGGYANADIAAYFAGLNLDPPNIIAVSVDGGSNSPTNPNSADAEVMLDIEVAGGVAPGAQIQVYFANNTNKSFLDAINEAIQNPDFKPAVISISWGSAEGSAGGWSTNSLNAFNEAFQSAAAMGITVCAAAGDDGSEDNVKDNQEHVDFPASSPYVLSCGGTHLSSSDNTITSEVVWHDSNGGGATGGGVSDIFELPAYQANANVGVSLNTGKPGRGAPDLAGDADPDSGYTIRVDGQTMQIGGTSAVAPLMAGLIARINEANGKPAGFIHPILYANPGICRDILLGNNITTVNKKGYTARPGWDACSGNGVPDGTKLMEALA